MAEVHHREIGRLAGLVRKRLRRAVGRKGKATQDDVALQSTNLMASDDTFSRPTVSAIEQGAARSVGPTMVATYIDVLVLMAAGKTGLPPQWDLLQELESLRGRLSGKPESTMPAPSDVTDAPSFAGLVIPSRTFDPTRSPPGALLRAEYGIVPFHGRHPELQDLMDWCEARPPVAVRLYTGPGGMGKTRLLIEACTRLASRGWATGFLGSRTDVADEGERALWRGATPTLVVLDYAETRQETLNDVLSALFDAQRTVPARVVLLARAADDWWQQLKGAGDHVGELISGPATERIHLDPLTLEGDARQASHALAVRAFATTLACPEPRDLDAAYEDPCYGRMLLLHMHALSLLGGVEVRGEQGVLDFILRRERRFWEMRARSVGLPPMVDKALGQALALVTLCCGVPNEMEALHLVKQLPVLEGQPRAVLTAIVGLLHELYGGDQWIDPVMPDLLGEHLVQTELAEDADRLLSIVLDQPSDSSEES